METNNNNNGKTVLGKGKTRGRVKIPLDHKIQKKANLQVTFSKRRQGLFRKASELSVLTGAQIAVIVRSPAGKLFSFSSPSFDAVMSSYAGKKGPSSDWQIVEQQEKLREGCGEGTGDVELKEDGWWNMPPIEEDGWWNMPPIEEDGWCKMPPIEEDGWCNLPPIEEDGWWNMPPIEAMDWEQLEKLAAAQFN